MTATKFLEYLNNEYVRLHHSYETLFWDSYMGNAKVDQKRDKAQNQLDAFRNNYELKAKAEHLSLNVSSKLKDRLLIWVRFFAQYQIPAEAVQLKQQIQALETAIQLKKANRTEGYIDPRTGDFVEASTLKMRTLMQTDADEWVRKACFDAREKLAVDCLDEYVTLVALRNQFASLIGYSDFYDYKLRHIDNMSKAELFGVFDNLFDKTKDIFAKFRLLEKTQRGVRYPWNFAYMLAGDFTKEEDQYFQFDQALDRWGRSFAALGIDFKGGSLKLDLLERKGKYNNGFCHWPDLVHFVNGVRQSGSANFTCLLVPGQVGSGYVAYNTLFHEGGHAAHILNCEQKDVCLNHEYAPMTAVWAETHSMFLDTMFDSIEWKSRYAVNAAGESYSLELFKKKEEKLHLLKPKGILNIVSVCAFEKSVYELKQPTAEKILQVARATYKKYNDFSVDSLWLLNTPHLYSWESACSYHGYGLAEIALAQWREYFYKKYGYIVDNKNVGKEMTAVWKLGSSKDFATCIKLATGKKLSSDALVREITRSPISELKNAKKKLARMKSVPEFKKPIDMNMSITMVHGKKEIANNKISFEAMAHEYALWVQKMSKKYQ